MVTQAEKKGQFAQKVEQSLGIVPGTKLWSPFPFAGLNLEDSPPAIDDKEFAYLENFFRLGNGYLRTAYDAGAPFYTSPGGRILPYFFWYNIGVIDYVIAFFDDGTAIQINQSSGAGTVVSSTPGTFYTGARNLPICSQSGNQYLIIANNNTANDYWLWDGSHLFGAGTVSPFIALLSGGQGYTSAPTITAFGGTGSGATFVATISDGSITNITVSNPGTGYSVADVVQLLFSGGGSDDSAALTAALTGDMVTSVAVTNAGSGFTSAPLLDFVGGGGAGATGIAVLTGTTIAAINITAGGTGFFHVPTITISAPLSGVTATATAAVDNGQVVSITITNAGSGYTGLPEILVTPDALDTLATGAGLAAILAATTIASVLVASSGANYTSAPAVLVEPGANKSAYANVDMMPFGVSGSALETFNSRVWLANPFQATTIPTGGIFEVSAAGSLTDFATSSGGVLFTNSDRFLRKQYVGIRQSNGYLYFFGDSSISVVSNIQTSGVPATTTFTYQNIDPQVGMAWRDTVQDFGRTIIFANETGVYGLYGGAATKISSKLDRLFENAIYPPDSRAVTPTASVATIFNIKYYFLYLTVQDPETGAVRNVMVGWDEKTWGVFSQTPALICVASQEVNSLNTVWGTDGTSIYPLFNRASNNLQKRITTKYYGTDQLLLLKDYLALWVQAQDMSGSGIDMTVSMISSGIAVQPNENNIDQESVASASFNSTTYPALLFQQPEFRAPFPYWPVFGTGTGGFSFAVLGAQFSTTSPDFAIANIMLAYLDNTAYM